MKNEPIDLSEQPRADVGTGFPVDSEPTRQQKLDKVAAISRRIRDAMELYCFIYGDAQDEVRDAECDLICKAVNPEMAKLIADALSGYVEVCELLGLPAPY